MHSTEESSYASKLIKCHDQECGYTSRLKPNKKFNSKKNANK